MARIQCPHCGGEMPLASASERAPMRVMNCSQCGKTLEQAQEAAARRSVLNQINGEGESVGELPGV